MAVYTVHQPPLRKGETTPDPDRFALVRDGFYFWAFLFGPLWMAWRRLWLVLVLYVVLLIGIDVGLRLVGGTALMRFVVMFAIALLVGLEAATLRRWTLNRRGWKNVGVVVGDDPEAAERRFFANWVDDAQHQSAPRGEAAKPQASGIRMPKGNPDIIGLFPEADRPR